MAPGDRSGGKARQVGGGKWKKGMEKKKPKKKEFKNSISSVLVAGKAWRRRQNTADATEDFIACNKSENTGNKKRKK